MMPSISILAALFLWSSLGVVVRTADVSETVIIFYSSLVAAVFQGAYFSIRGWSAYIPDRRHLKYLAMLGCVGLFNTFAFYYAFRHTTIANAVLTHYIAPVIVAFLAAVFLKEKLTGMIALAILLSSAGLLIMLGRISATNADTAGIIAGLFSGCAYAVIIIIARNITRQIHPLMMTFVPNFMIAVLLSPFIREFPLHAAWIFVLMGVVHSTAAPMLYYWGMKSVSANKTAVLGYLEPVMAIVFSMIFLKEIPGLRSLGGGALIILSGYITMRNRDENKASVNRGT
ncbi:MAG: DMT family transporter [Nitrospirae bacterium]|nr:DMT family transporter [Nitrospirota bacterium]